MWNEIVSICEVVECNEPITFREMFWLDGVCTKCKQKEVREKAKTLSKQRKST